MTPETTAAIASFDTKETYDKAVNDYVITQKVKLHDKLNREERKLVVVKDFTGNRGGLVK